MTRTFKKIISVIITAAMVMMLGLTAFAAAPYDITITRSANDKSEHTYTAYQVFSGSIQPDQSLANIQWGSGVDGTALLAALKTANSTAYSGCTKASDVAAVLEADSSLADQFAKIASANTDTEAGRVVSAAGETSATITIAGAGYYLITDQIDTASPNSNENSSVSRLMLKVDTTHTSTAFAAKAVVPSISKEIGDGTAAGVDANTASIGDTVPFVLRTAVPDMTGYTKYFFVVKDTMSKGLTFDASSVSVTLGGATLAASNYTVTSSANAQGGTDIKIVFKNFISNHNAASHATDNCGKPIIIKYNATLNENCDRTSAGNPNTVYLEYSNNPNVVPSGENEPSGTDPVGKTPESKTITYTTGVKVIKTDTNGNKLPGATFEISGLGGTKVVTVKGVYTKDNTLTDPDKTFYKLKDGTYTKTAPTAGTMDKYDSDDKYKYSTSESVETVASSTVTATVDPDGYIVFSGLGDGTYTITETQAPDGYIKSDEDITFTVSSDPDSTTGPNWKIAIGSGSAAAAPFVDAEETIIKEFTVENPKKSNLPQTGGIGTTVFYIAGSILVVSGVALLLAKKRSEATER